MNQKKTIINYFNGELKIDLENYFKIKVVGAKLINDRFGYNKRAYKFDGINDYIEVINSRRLSFSNESFSISLWVKIKDNENTYRTFFVISNKELMPRIEIMKGRSEYDEFKGNIYIQIAESKEHQSTAISLKNGEELEKNQWTHIVGVVDYDNLKLSLFINNKIQQVVDLINNFSMPKEKSLIVRIGQSSSSSNAWNKQRHNDAIDDIKIYNGVLNKKNIRSLFYSKKRN